MSCLQEFFLESQRLGFRHWSVDDLELAVGLWGDPEVTRFVDARGRLTKAAVEERLREEIALQREHGVQYWPIFDLATGEHVGCCGLRPYDPSRRIFELGCHVRSFCWRRGYASEASTAVIDLAFGSLRVAKLFAGHNPGNAASRRLLGKMGFRYSHDEPYAATGLDHPSYYLDPRGV